MQKKKNNTDLLQMLSTLQKEIGMIRVEQSKYYEEFDNKFLSIKNDINNLYQRLSVLDEVNLKNGNGRIIKMLRDEFYQMIYDKIQFKFVANKIGKFISVLLTILLIINLVLTIFFR